MPTTNQSNWKRETAKELRLAELQFGRFHDENDWAEKDRLTTAACNYYLARK